ncbi:MAG: patatin-like phospholipase family protein [Alphaproteobacteria bacterium]|nr:patatin-like phospholipase family protein [Alphaproteobacteria bacterium]
MPPTKKISLALQGGGSHGAFSWGVIDQLLLDGRVEIEAVSATSGGSLNAVVMAQGLINNGADGAREALQKFWKKVSVATSVLPIQMKAVDTLLGNVGLDLSPSTMALDYITRIFSPSQFNLLGINPLQGILEEVVDFDALQKNSPITIYINATHVRTGKNILFDTPHITLESVLASSCLPFVFKTVEIDGEPFWDGSFSACPSLSPLANFSKSSDIVLVQVHPSQAEEVPTHAADILDRATEISFNAVLRQELKTISLYNRMIDAGALKQKPVYFHRIESQEMLSGLGRASKLNADWDFLVYLHDLGVQAATDWLEKNFVTLGQKSSAEFE